MAILGFHVVISLIVLTVLSKLGSRSSLLKLLVHRLIRYIAPSNDELRALLPQKTETRAKKRKQQKDEEDINGFNLPRQLPLELKTAYVRVDELERFPMYSSIHWLCLYVPACAFIVFMSEAYLLWNDKSTDINTSLVWLVVGIAFALQILARLTALLLSGSDEKSLLFSLSILTFFGLFVLTVFVDRFFDISLLDAYTHLRTTAAKMANEEVVIKPESPLLLYISLVLLFSTIGCGLIFPSFRYATMYSKAALIASPSTKILMHSTFLLPMVIIALFTHPIKLYLTEGRRVWLTVHQLDILRVYACIFWVFLRLVIFRPLLQAHLDLAYDKVSQLQRQTGKIRNIELQSMIFRYYSYLCPAIAQYLAPTTLILLLSILLKCTTGMTWSGVQPDIVEVTSDMASLSSIFNTTVCRAILSFSIISITITNLGLSLTGVVYNGYFQ